MHRFLARLPRCSGSTARRTSSSSRGRYDLAIERAFEEAGEEVDVVTYVAAGPYRGKFWHRPPGEEPRPIDVPNTYATELSLDRRTILLKLHGAVDPFPEREWESFVITEDDYIDYLGSSDVAAAVPVALAARLRRSHFLFLGYEMVDWNLRLVMHRVWGDRPVAYRSWAVDPEPTRARAGVLAPLRRRRARRRPGRVRRAPRTAPRGRRVSVASPYRGLAAFEDSELDALYFFGRERDTRSSSRTSSRRAHRALRAERRRQVVAPPRGVARALRELPEEPLVVVFSNWGDDPAAGARRGRRRAAGDRGGELVETSSSARRPAATST